MNWSGRVTKVSEREWGTKMIYSWQIEGTSQWFRSETNLGVEEDKCYTFEGESAQKITSAEETAPEEIKAAAEARKNDVVPPTSSPDYWRWKQMRDLELEKVFKWRDARSDAARIVCTALETGALSFGQAKVADKLDLLRGFVHTTTKDLIRDMEIEHADS